jgi:hypothetical protein
MIFSGCSDFLNREPLDKFGEDAVWSDLPLMETFVNNIYYETWHGFWGKIGMQMMCDEACRTSDRGAAQITNSLASPSDVFAFKEGGLSRLTWDRSFQRVRACNLFLAQSSKPERNYDDQAMLQRLTGEVHFLRAFTYQSLAFMYGGVPRLDMAYTLNDDGLIARNSFEEIISFIVADCDKAAELLDGHVYAAEDYGRATKGAALALKARVLLYAASELYNNPSWATGYTNPELIAYTKTDAASRNARWLAAKNAAKAVMDLNRYGLYKPEPAATDDIAKNYGEIFLLKQTVEDIFVRQFTQINYESNEVYHPGLHHMPGGYHSHGSNNPIGQVVDDYEMADGSKFDWTNPEHKAHPYENREPRFYASILYDGMVWRARPVDVQPLDPTGTIQTGFFENADGSRTPGLDTRSSPIEPANGTHSGYYQRKFIDPAYNFQYEVQESPWRHLRYTEILLSYAEACNELGEDGEALSVINQIRKRAGLPEISGTGNDLREKIRHERRVELMFEGQRYFDIRRWMIAPRVMVNATGIGILHKYNGPVEYSVIPVQNRKWENRAYFFPIHMDEMNKNNLLVQNPLH